MSNPHPHDPARTSRSPGTLPTGTASYQRGAAVLEEQLKVIPALPGVYRMLSQKNAILYVGKAKNLVNRVAHYTRAEGLSNRIQRMVALTYGLEVITTPTESEALLLEANLIRHHQPPFNVLLRDDKSFPYILIRRDHPFPPLLKYRGAKEDKGWYYGPFASIEAVGETITLMLRGFQLRNCTDSMFASRQRPCLQYHIKRCTAPCVGRVTAEAYAEQVAQARDFLAGKNDAVLSQLQAEMLAASEQLHYEKAGELRDRIKMLAAIHSKQSINLAELGDADVIALAQEGGQACIQVFFFRNDRNYGNRAYFPEHSEGMEDEALLSTFLAQFYSDKPPPPRILLSHAIADAPLLEEALASHYGSRTQCQTPKQGDKKRVVEMALQNAREALARKLAERQSQAALLAGVAKLFDLPAPPQRIEVYDNSHISGSHAVGAMVVAGAEGFIKKAYRKFTMKNPDLVAGDDYAMMREMLTRRFSRALAEHPEQAGAHWPDVVLVDGGQGQLNAALAVLAELGLPQIRVIGIAKGVDRHAGRERFFIPGQAPFTLEPHDPLLYYLQRLRDEAHRFAITTHRHKRSQAIRHSPLDGVPGIGAARKKQLLLHFGSAAGVAKAGLEDLQRTPGISAALAKKLYEYFH